MKKFLVKISFGLLLLVGCSSPSPSTPELLENIVNKHELREFSDLVMTIIPFGTIFINGKDAKQLLREIKKANPQELMRLSLEKFEQGEYNEKQLKYLSIYLIVNKFCSSKYDSVNINRIIVEALRKKDDEALVLLCNFYMGVCIHKRKCDPQDLENLILLAEANSITPLAFSSFTALVLYRCPLERMKEVVEKLPLEELEPGLSLTENRIERYTRRNMVDYVAYYTELQSMLKFQMQKLKESTDQK